MGSYDQKIKSSKIIIMPEREKIHGYHCNKKPKYEQYCETCDLIYVWFKGNCIKCGGKLTKVCPGRYVGPIKRQRIYDRDNNRCVKCGNFHKLTIDHINAISKGGNNEDDNLQTMCEKCNSDKGCN